MVVDAPLGVTHSLCLAASTIGSNTATDAHSLPLRPSLFHPSRAHQVWDAHALSCYRRVKGSAAYWPERGEDTRTRHVNDLVLAFAKARQGVGISEPAAQF